MLHLAKAQLYNMEESTKYSTGELECTLGITSGLYANCSLSRRKFSESAINVWHEDSHRKYKTRFGNTIF